MHQLLLLLLLYRVILSFILESSPLSLLDLKKSHVRDISEYVVPDILISGFVGLNDFVGVVAAGDCEHESAAPEEESVEGVPLPDVREEAQQEEEGANQHEHEGQHHRLGGHLLAGQELPQRLVLLLLHDLLVLVELNVRDLQLLLRLPQWIHVLKFIVSVLILASSQRHVGRIGFIFHFQYY